MAHCDSSEELQTLFVSMVPMLALPAGQPLYVLHSFWQHSDGLGPLLPMWPSQCQLSPPLLLVPAGQVPVKLAHVLLRSMPDRQQPGFPASLYVSL